MHVSLSVDSESAAVCTSAAKSRIHGELSIAALEALRHPKPGFCDGDRSTTTRDLKCPPWRRSGNACRTQMLWRKSKKRPRPNPRSVLAYLLRRSEEHTSELQ